MQQASNFMLQFSRIIESGEYFNFFEGLEEHIDLDLSETFEDSPDTALRNIKSRDINIILGFFGPQNARKVLCKVGIEWLCTVL